MSSKLTTPEKVFRELSSIYPNMDRDELRRLVNEKFPRKSNEIHCCGPIEKPVEIDVKCQNEDVAGKTNVLNDNNSDTIVLEETSSESDSNDEFETFLEREKTPKKLPGSSEDKRQSFDDFIVLDDDEDVCSENVRSKENLWKYETPASVKSGRMRTFSTPGSAAASCSTCPDLRKENEFLAALNSQQSLARDDAVEIYFKNFKKHKDDLVRRLLAMFNEHVFENKLPRNFECTWNKRMTKTAGFCYPKMDKTKNERWARIELSDKVCSDPERVRDTLIHEMCHAYVWIAHGYRGGHGSLWKHWAYHARDVFPSLAPITRCHAYEIKAKYVYVCTTCNKEVRRHSKSLDITKYVCAHCRGRFELRITDRKENVPNAATPQGRPTPKFAAFVQKNYSSAKREKPTARHGEIMKELGEKFKRLDFEEM